LPIFRVIDFPKVNIAKKKRIKFVSNYLQKIHPFIYVFLHFSSQETDIGSPNAFYACGWCIRIRRILERLTARAGLLSFTWRPVCFLVSVNPPLSAPEIVWKIVRGQRKK
jgi:hypothetical protein